MSKRRLTGLYTLRARWALGPVRSLLLPHFLADAPAYRRASDGKEEQNTQHQPRAHAYPSLLLRVGTSYTAGTLCAMRFTLKLSKPHLL
jgi:hypothetical protein